MSLAKEQSIKKIAPSSCRNLETKIAGLRPKIFTVDIELGDVEDADDCYFKAVPQNKIIKKSESVVETLNGSNTKNRRTAIQRKESKGQFQKASTSD
jgi:hypothetical protein